MDAQSVIDGTVVCRLSWQYLRAPTLDCCSLSHRSSSSVYSTIPSRGSTNDSWCVFSIPSFSGPVFFQPTPHMPITYPCYNTAVTGLHAGRVDTPRPSCVRPARIFSVLKSLYTQNLTRIELSGTHYRKLFSVVTPLQFLSLGERHSSSLRLSLLSLLTNTLPGPSASEVTTLWRYINLFIIIIIIIIVPTPSWYTLLWAWR